MKKSLWRNVGWVVWLTAGALACIVAGSGGAEPAATATPHPVVAWPSGPFEVRVAFDRPLHPGVARGVVGRMIPFEEETSVMHQASAKKRRPSRVESTLAHRGALRIAAARLEDQGRTLVLVTDPQSRVATYSLHLTGILAPDQAGAGESIDMMYGLGGVEASWDDGKENSPPRWTGWWPDLDPEVTRKLSVGSVQHERSLALLQRPGRLVLNTLFVLPKGPHTLRLAANVPITAVIAGESARAVDQPGGGQVVDVPIDSTGEPIDFAVMLPTGVGGNATTFRASYTSQAKPKEVPLAHERLLIPWATTNPPIPGPPQLPDGLAGGDPGRGEAIFFGTQAKCSSCHTIGGKGGNVGPELGHQFERPSAEVYRDIADPGVWVNPDYIAYTVALKDGRVLVGIVRAEGAEAIRVTDTDARSTVVKRTDLEEIRPSSTSIMPVGLAGALGDGPLRDLLAFLTHPPAGGRAASR